MKKYNLIDGMSTLKWCRIHSREDLSMYTLKGRIQSGEDPHDPYTLRPTRTSSFKMVDGVLLNDWCRSHARKDVSWFALRSRILVGEDPHDPYTLRPVGVSSNKQKKTYKLIDGVSTKKWCELHQRDDLSCTALRQRIERGEDPHDPHIFRANNADKYVFIEGISRVKWSKLHATKELAWTAIVQRLRKGIEPKKALKPFHRCSIIYIKGVKHMLYTWCEIFSLPVKLVLIRLNKLGWDVEESLTTPIKVQSKKGTKELETLIELGILT